MRRSMRPAGSGPRATRSPTITRRSPLPKRAFARSASSSARQPWTSPTMTVRPLIEGPLLAVELGALRDHDDASLAHVPALLVLREIVADLGVLRDLHVLVDDGAADARVAADDHVLEEHALLDVAEGVHAHPVREHAPVDAAAGDDAAEGDEALGRDADARVGLVTEDELGRRVV